MDILLIIFRFITAARVCYCEALVHGDIHTSQTWAFFFFLQVGKGDNLHTDESKRGFLCHVTQTFEKCQEKHWLLMSVRYNMGRKCVIMSLTSLFLLSFSLLSCVLSRINGRSLIYYWLTVWTVLCSIDWHNVVQYWLCSHVVQYWSSAAVHTRWGSNGTCTHSLHIHSPLCSLCTYSAYFLFTWISEETAGVGRPVWSPDGVFSFLFNSK